MPDLSDATTASQASAYASTPHQVTAQLRCYSLTANELAPFVSWWQANIVPLRHRLGFAIPFGYVDSEQNMFTWCVCHPGSEADFAAAEERYNAEPERLQTLATAPYTPYGIDIRFVASVAIDPRDTSSATATAPGVE